MRSPPNGLTMLVNCVSMRYTTRVRCVEKLRICAACIWIESSQQAAGLRRFVAGQKHSFSQCKCDVATVEAKKSAHANSLEL